MTSRAAIVGVGQTVHAPNRPDVDYSELVHEAVKAALADAGIGLLDIDNSVTAAMDFWDGRTIANMSTAEVVGSYLKSEARVCADAIGALTYGWTRIADSSFKIGLVVAHCKESAGNLHDIENAGFDPFSERRLDADGDVVAGLIARSLESAEKLDLEEAATLVAAGRRVSSTHAELTALDNVDAAAIRDAPMLADPLTVLDKAPQADGAAALVLVAEEAVGDFSHDPVWVTGVGSSTDRYWTHRDLTSFDAVTAAGDRARTMAGWGTDSPDLVETSAQFSFQLAPYANALGWTADNNTALNTSGGWHAGNPYIVTGLSRVIEGVRQLRGSAGDRQLSDVQRVLAHGTSGMGGQAQFVAALERG
ncbi:MAG: thiolase family protein [Acidimicrobiia bacterium]